LWQAVKDAVKDAFDFMTDLRHTDVHTTETAQPQRQAETENRKVERIPRPNKSD
jgi:hypothetical protein